MKMLFTSTIIAFMLVGCGKKLPTECQKTMELYDQYVAKIKDPKYKIPMQEMVLAGIEKERQQIKDEIKTLSTEEANQACQKFNLTLRMN